MHGNCNSHSGSLWDHGDLTSDLKFELSGLNNPCSNAFLTSKRLYWTNLPERSQIWSIDLLASPQVKIILAQDQPTSREFHRYSYFLHNSGLTPHSSSKWAKISLPYHRGNDPKSGMRAQATASAGARTPKLCDVVGVSSVSRRMKNGRTKQLSLLEPPSVWLSTGLGSYTCT